MDEPARSTRPRHTTFAAGLVIGGSALAVIGVVDQLGALHSLDTREALQKFLDRPPGSDLGMGLDDVRSALRAVLMVVAGCATAALVLGFGVLRRDHRSRLALTVLAAPLFVGGLVTGGVWTTVVAAAAVFLWLGPSGDWFAGRTPRTARTPTAGPSRPRAEEQRPAPPTTAQVPTQQQQPPPHLPPYPAPPPGWQPPAYVQGPPVQPRRRPGTVLAACVMTWSLSGLAIVLMSLVVGLVAASPDTLWTEALRQRPELADQGFTRDDLVTATLVVGVVAIVWAMVAIVLASLVYHGSNGARVALVVSGCTAAVLCLLGTLSSPLLVLPLVVCAGGASLLLRPEAQAWCRRTQDGPRA